MADTVTTTTTATPFTQTQGTAPEPSATQGAQFDYEKLASIIEGKQKVAEDTVLKGYFKEQGLTGDEMKAAIEMFKKDKAAKAPDVAALNAEIEQGKGEIAKAEQRALMAETKVAAMTMSAELGVDQKTIPYLLKMADLTAVTKDGAIDPEKLKESLNAVLNDVPQLKAQAQEIAGGFKVGADTSGGSTSNNDELARIFGVQRR